MAWAQASRIPPGKTGGKSGEGVPPGKDPGIPGEGLEAPGPAETSQESTPDVPPKPCENPASSS